MIGAIAVLLLMQLLGTLLAQFLQIPLPGPVVGMLLLFAYLLWRGSAPAPLVHTTQPMLENLSLLFVPISVGVVSQLPLLQEYGARIALVLLLSTVLGLAATAWVLRLLLRVPADAQEENGRG